MKTSNYISFCTFALSCLFAFSLSSCSTEDVPRIDGDYGYIFTTIRTPNTLGLTDEDDVIHTIRIFVFVGELLETQKLFERDEDEWKNSFRLRVTTGRKNVMVVANETDLMTPELEDVETLQDLYIIMADPLLNDEPFHFNPAHGIPMTGSGVATLLTANEVYETIIALTRLTAKLEIVIIDEAPYPFRIKSITLENNKTTSLLWDRSDDAFLTAHEDDFFDIDVNINNSHPTSPIGIRRAIEDGRPVWRVDFIYLYENLHGQENIKKATRLVVETELDLGGGETFIVTHEVYINQHLPPPSPITGYDLRFLIQRGHHYRLTGTIWGTEYTHISVKMEAKPWNDDQGSNHRPLPPPQPRPNN